MAQDQDDVGIGIGTGSIFDAAPDAPGAQHADADDVAQEGGMSADPTTPPTSLDAAQAETSADTAAHIDAIENIFSQMFPAGKVFE